jgi:NTP pyrophosphatase (non-canonical NTP hydrolase)
MDLNEYQEKAHQTAIYNTKPEYQDGKRDIPITDNTSGLIYTSLGLNGESGEVAEEVKKMIRDDKGILTEDRKERMKGELGDVLWYVASMANELGFALNDIACYNLEKLARRYEQ